MDKNTDFTFMKTGFNLVDDNKHSEFEKNIVAMVTAFGENALRTSAQYTTHAKRQVVTPEDIKRAMMLEVFLYTKRPGIVETCQKIKDELFGDDEEEEEEEEEEVEEQLFEESNCECALCQCLNTIHDRWAKWEPQTPIEMILKKHIDAIES